MNINYTPRATGDLAQHTCPPPDPTHEPATITLRDLGPRTSETLARFCNDPEVTARGFWQCRIVDYRPRDILTQNGIPSFSLEGDNNSRVDSYVTEIKPSEGKNTVFQLHYSDPAHFRRFKDVSLTSGHLFSSKALRSPQALRGRYFVGDWSCLHGNPSPLLSCGPQLEDLFVDSVKPGITTPYLYYAQNAFTGSGMHIEDLAVPSVNLVRWGAPKKWLFITPEPGNVRNFENKCRKTFPHRKCVKHRQAQPECSQFVRHSNALFSTEALREWGIKFTETTCQEGEMVVTLPGTYHQVVNEGENLAEAVNVIWSGCRDVPMAYAYCSRNLCGHSGSISQDDLAPRMRSLQD